MGKMKERFLETLESQSHNKYKRYPRLPLRYPGGKSRAVGHILEHIPDDVNFLVSPFFGGGSVEFACARELNMEVRGFDIFDILTNYWKVQLMSPLSIYIILVGLYPDKETYADVKQELKDHWEGTKLIEDKVRLAALFWFNYNLSYGPGFLGWMSSIYEDENRYRRMIQKVWEFESPNTMVFCRSFEYVLEQYPRSFLYCDPPYMLGEGSSVFKGIYPQRNFPIHHKDFDHEKLRDMLHSHEERFVLSYNDCDKIREWYSDFEIVPLEWQYTMGQGETRIGANRKTDDRNHVKKSKELLIVKR